MSLGTAILNPLNEDEIFHFKVTDSKNLTLERRETDPKKTHIIVPANDYTYTAGPIQNPSDLVAAKFNNVLTVYGLAAIPPVNGKNVPPVIAQLSPIYNPVVSKEAKHLERAQPGIAYSALSVAADPTGNLNYIFFLKENAADADRASLVELKLQPGVAPGAPKAYSKWTQPITKSRLASVYEPACGNRAVFYQADVGASDYISWGWTDGTSVSRVDNTNSAMDGTPLAATLVQKPNAATFTIYLYFVDNAYFLKGTTWTGTKEAPGKWSAPTNVKNSNGAPISVTSTSGLFVVTHPSGNHNHVFYTSAESDGYIDQVDPLVS